MERERERERFRGFRLGLKFPAIPSRFRLRSRVPTGFPEDFRLRERFRQDSLLRVFVLGIHSLGFRLGLKFPAGFTL